MPSVEQLLEEDGRLWRQEILQAVQPTEQAPPSEEVASVPIVDSTKMRDDLRGRKLPALVAAAVVVIIGGVIVAVVSQTGQTSGNRAGGKTSRSQQLQPQPGATDPRKPIPDRGFTPTPAVPVTAAQAAHMLSFPWKLTFASNSSSTIGIYYYGAGGPGCGEVKGIYVKETAESVLIDVAALPPTAESCASILRTGSADITLDHPLGDRAIVHAVVSNGYRISDF